jgi:hypothetical protein
MPALRAESSRGQHRDEHPVTVVVPRFVSRPHYALESDTSLSLARRAVARRPGDRCAVRCDPAWRRRGRDRSRDPACRGSAGLAGEARLLGGHAQNLEESPPGKFGNLARRWRGWTQMPDLPAPRWRGRIPASRHVVPGRIGNVADRGRLRRAIGAGVGRRRGEPVARVRARGCDRARVWRRRRERRRTAFARYRLGTGTGAFCLPQRDRRHASPPNAATRRALRYVSVLCSGCLRRTSRSMALDVTKRLGAVSS